MGVKTIFKTLFLTVILMVVAAVVIELYNINTTTLQINRVISTSCKQACRLYSQETYKKYENDSGIINMRDIEDSNGEFYVTGNFYTSDNPETIYNDLYNNNEFIDWATNNEAVKKGKWENLEILVGAFKDGSRAAVGTEDYDKVSLGKMYKDRLITPTNLGIPYLDVETVEKMFRWNLTEMFSNCDSDLIKVDSSGNKYVYYKGFRIYTSNASIKNLEYKTFDLSIQVEREEFEEVTNINPDNLGIDISGVAGTGEDERSRICVVGVTYSVPMSYEGVSPVKNIFNYIWRTNAGGQEWNDMVEDYESGGFDNGTSGTLPIPGDLIYYIVR